MGFKDSIQIRSQVKVSAGIFLVDWVADSGVGFLFGRMGNVPKTISGPLNLDAFCPSGRLIINYPCFPGEYCEISGLFPSDSFDEIGGLSVLRELFAFLNIPCDESYYLSIVDSSGQQDFEGRKFVLI